MKLFFQTQKNNLHRAPHTLRVVVVTLLACAYLMIPAITQAAGVTLVGTLYENDGVTAYSGVATVTAAVRGVSDTLYSTTTATDGSFILTNIATSSPDTTFATTSSPSTATWGSVAYGNGTFIARGRFFEERTMTSPDGINWTGQSVVPDGTTVYFAGGKFFAPEGTTMYLSEDGFNWTTHSLAIAPHRIVYGDGLYVTFDNCASDTGDCLAYSEDGITWATSTISGGNDNWTDLAYGNGRFVAVANCFNSADDCAAYSEDGITWATTTSITGEDDRWQSVEFGNDRFVAVSDVGARVMYSTDNGETWSQDTGITDALGKVVYGNGYFMALADVNKTCETSTTRCVWQSTDGTGWQALTAATTTNYNAIGFGAGTFVLLGPAGNIAYIDAGFGEHTPVTLYVDSDDTATSTSATTLTFGMNDSSGTTTLYADLVMDTVTLKKTIDSQEIDLSTISMYDSDDDADILIHASSSTTTVTADLVIASSTAVIAPLHLFIDGDYTNNGTFIAQNGAVTADAERFDSSRPIYSTSTSIATGDTGDPFISTDGSYVYYVTYGGLAVEQYEMSTPYDISSASFLRSQSLSLTGSVRGLTFSPAGDVMAVYATGDEKIVQYTLSTPWNISTLGTAASSTHVGDVNGMDFSADGKYLYLTDTTTDEIDQYPLATAWDTTTKGTRVQLNLSGASPDAIDVVVSDDGMKLFLADNSNAAGEGIDAYLLTTPHDLATVSYVQTFDTTAFDTDLFGVTFADHGSEMYVLGRQNDNIYQFTLDKPQTFSGTMVGTSSFASLTNNSQLGLTLDASASSTATTTITTNAATTTFSAGSTYTFERIDWQGSSSTELLRLQSTDTGTQWNLDVTGSSTVTFVDVSDSDATLTTGGITAATSTDSGNNTNWFGLTGGAGATSITIANHEVGQVSDAFNYQDKTNEVLFAFKITPNEGGATITDIDLHLSGAKRITVSDFSNIRLYRDIDNDAEYDESDVQVGGTGVLSLDEGYNNQQGSILFSTSFLATASLNYIVVADWNAQPRGSALVIDLESSGVTALSGGEPISTTGSVDDVRHSRNRSGGGGVSTAVGNAAPAGDGAVSGGTNTGGEQIGSAADFFWPTADSGGWTTGANAYDQTDGTYATDTSGASQTYSTFNDSVPSNNTIEGIVVKLEVSGTTAAGDIGVELSWDGGTSWTSSKNTPTMTTTDTVIELGSESDTWGRSWSINEFSNANFSVRLTGNPSSNTVQVDAIQVKVYHLSSGGSSGGGGAI